MINESEKIFSSTGELGVSRRQDQRLYVNALYYSDQPEQIQTLNRIAEVIVRRPQQVSRGVFRGVVSEEVFSAIAANGLHDRMEVALPIAEFTHPYDHSQLVVWAHNDPQRRQLVSDSEMIMATEENRYRETDVTPTARIEQVRRGGGMFRSSITDEQIENVQQLWGPTFGWSQEEVSGLQHRLEQERSITPSDKSVWFSAIEREGRLVSLAMAERLTIPRAEGELDLIESTEWKTCDSQSGKGLMTANLSMLYAQILHDLQGSEHGLPLIYAECNFQSRSDWAGHGAGMRIPERTLAPQILRQNVGVSDGQEIAEGVLRDFTFLYLPRTSIERWYSKEQTEAMLQEGGLR